MKTEAEKAVAEFETTGIIPDRGQRVHEGMGPGAVHVFSDGSIAAHWSDGAFIVAEVSHEEA